MSKNDPIDDDMSFINECLFYDDMEALFTFLMAFTDSKHIRYNTFRNCIEIYLTVPETDEQIREALTPLPNKKESYKKSLSGPRFTFNVGTSVAFTPKPDYDKPENRFDATRKVIDEYKEYKRQEIARKKRMEKQ